MIILDYRERKIIPLMFEIDNRIDLYNLPIGDIVIPINEYAILIERKTPQDFSSSIKTRRIFDQASRIFNENYILNYKINKKLLLIHGDFNDEYNFEGLKISSIYGAILDLRYRYKIDVFIAYNDYYLKEFLRILKKREIEGKDEREIENMWERRPLKSDDVESWKIYVLTSLPYVGEKTAKLLIDKYKTIENITKANISDLMKIPGIGEKKAKKIYEILHQ
ncbi:MAG: helix-hairpin-helix domain-containing protein [Thermoplasmata archaeon]